MAVTTIPSAGLTLGAQVNFRNLIINGDMSIAQRGTSFSSMSNGQFITDRFFYDRAGLGVTAAFTGSQSTDVPSGTSFANSLKMDVTTAQTLGASGGTFLGVTTKVEGFNYKLTSNQVATISFWVKSNLTGTYSIVFRNNGNDRVLVEEYTINSASTWEKKTITLPTFTTDGTWNYTNGMGVSIFFCLAVAGDNDTSTIGSWISSGVTSIYGSSNNVEFASSTSNEWYITGVQLEVGTSASDFEFLPYDVNFRRCQRYHFRHNPSKDSQTTIVMGIANGGSDMNSVLIPVPVQMRANPSLSTDPASGSVAIRWWKTTGNTGTISSYTTLASQGDGPSDGSGFLALTINGFGGNLVASAPNGIEFESTDLILDSEL